MRRSCSGSPCQERFWRLGSTDARALLEYAIASNCTFHAFELGNEQDRLFTAAQAARNFATLNALLHDLYPLQATRPLLVGPDVHGFHGSDGEEGDEKLQYLVDFARNCSALGVPLHAITHHEYIEVEQYPAMPANATQLDITKAIARKVSGRLALEAPKAELWAGEIGPHNGHNPGCSHGSMRWANWGDTFWYLDAMATKAAHGYSVFCRQDFVGIDYGIVDCATYDPLPDYFGGVLFGRLMGQGVLSVVQVNGPESIRAYAHCTPGGGSTALLLNLDPRSPAEVSLGHFGGTSSARLEWHLSGPSGTNATAVALNGKALGFEVDDSGEVVLPSLCGRHVVRVPGNEDSVHLAPASIAFVHVSDGAASELCSAAGTDNTLGDRRRAPASWMGEPCAR